jgi:hypothetical protein
MAMQTGNLGFAIASVIGLGFAGVFGLMGSLLVANLRDGARAREAAARARDEAVQRFGRSAVHDLRALLGAALPRAAVELPSQAVPVLAVESELRELLAQVAAQAASASTGAAPRVHARIEGTQAVVHWRDVGAAPLRACERIAAGLGGRLYAASHAGGPLGLTLRLPLHGGPASR